MNLSQTRSRKACIRFEFFVAGSSQPPSLTHARGFKTAKDASLSIFATDPLANDTDADLDQLASQCGAPSALGATVSLVATATTYDPTGSIELSRLAAKEVASDSFEYTDSDGATSIAKVMVRVLGDELVRFRFDATDSVAMNVTTNTVSHFIAD